MTHKRLEQIETRVVVTAHSIDYLEATLAEVKLRLKSNSSDFMYTHLVVIKDALEELLHRRRQEVGVPLVHPHPDPRCTCGPESRCSYCW